jgi:nitrate reductase molybdenum cofactor assembly chaperone
MDGTCALYDALAGLLAYPNPEQRVQVAHCRQALAEQFSDAAALLARFAERTAGLTSGEMEELYTHTFDLDPVSSLEVGWHLWGENYSRGEFLVLMRCELRRLGLEESTELPDHLTHVLPAVARMEPQTADRFTLTYVLPALAKMLAGLGAKDSPYANVLEAIRCVLTSPYGAVRAGSVSDGPALDNATPSLTLPARIPGATP